MRIAWPESRFLLHRRAHSIEAVAENARFTDSPRRRAQLAQTLKALALSRRLPLYLALLSAVLVAPSLFTGFQLDDYAHRFCILGNAGSDALCPSPLEPFAIATGQADFMHRSIEHGFSPFWAYSGLIIRFMRPLAGLSHYVDYHLFPNSPAIMHAESIAWLAAAIFFATLFYRATIGVGTVSMGAAFALAVDHVHGVPVGWIANRNAVMSACLATAALVLYERSTRRPSPRTTLGGVACLLLGFLCGEIALGAWAYLVAHALVLDRRSPGARARGLLPYAGVTIAWRTAYSLLGYGAYGSAIYLDPGREPLAFLRALPSRIPLLVQGLFGFPMAESFYFTTPTLARIGLVCAVCFCFALVVAFARLSRLDPLARFWALGCALSLFSACSAVPHNRLLFFPSLGAMGLLAVAVDAFSKNDARLPTGIARKVSQLVVALSGGLHVFVSPLLLPLAACTVALTHTIADRAIPSAIAAMTDVPHQDLVIVSAPEYYVGEFAPFIEQAAGRPAPEKLRILSIGAVTMHAERLDAHTLELTYDHGLLEDVPLRLHRDAEHPMKAGDTIELDGLRIVVTRVTDDGRPAVATFTFAEPLDAPKLKWVIWQKDHFVPFSPPQKDGEVVDIPAARNEFVFG